MDIAIAGAHGQIARRLSRLLNDRGHHVRGIIRNPDQADDVRADGAEPVVLDLEKAEMLDVDGASAGCVAVSSAAGAGPGSGSPRKETVDFGAAVTLIHAAQRADVPRYVMVSAIGIDNPPTDDDVYSVYVRAKARADEAL